MKIIQLTQGEQTLVDDDDYEWLSERNWVLYARKGGGKYVRRLETLWPKKRVYMHMHKVIMNCPDDMEVDHIDGNGLNNQKHNMRICTRAQNVWNRCANKAHGRGVKGVTFSKRYNYWRCRIGKGGKSFFLGNFKSIVDAAMAYNEKAKELFGEFAKLNTISR